MKTKSKNNVRKILFDLAAAAGIGIAADHTAGDKANYTAVNGNTYYVSGDSIIQDKGSCLDDGMIKLGVVSDIHGAVENAEKSAEKLRKQVKNLDAVIIAGDSYENPSFYGHAQNGDDMQRMIDVISPYAKLRVPVLVIPGEQEERKVYSKAIAELKKTFPNVFDINGVSADLNGVNFVGLGGYNFPITAPNGFAISGKDYEKALSSIKAFQAQNEPTIFVTHGPPKSNPNSKSITDCMPRIGRVGDEKLALIMKKPFRNLINIHGHVHEGGNSLDLCEAGPALNIASITDCIDRETMKVTNGNTFVIVIKNRETTYELLK